MKILIPLFSPPTGTWGSLTRVLAIGDAAKTLGHTIAFCASGDLADRLEQNGYRVYRTPSSTLLGLPKFISNKLEARSQNNSVPVKPGQSIGSIWLVLFFTGMTRVPYLKRLVQAELKAVDDFKPDRLFTELDPGAFLISRITGIPIASTYASIMRKGIGNFPWKRLKKAENIILREYGKPMAEPQELSSGKHVLKIIPSIPELEESIPDTSDYVFTGSLLKSFKTATDQSFQVEEGKRYIFVYVGTGSVTQTKLRQVLPKVFPEGSNTYCLVGAQSVQTEERIGNVIFRPFFDAEALMPRCDWVICHGGHNTIIQSLLHRVPLIIFPGPIFERRFNAEMVQRSGAGVFGELPDFNAEWLKNVIRERKIYAAKAAAMGEKIESYEGAAAAVKVMEEFGSK